MGQYQALKSTIQNAIKQNGNNEITGDLLQQSLLAMINSLGAGYQFVGVATPETTPITPDYRAFYILGPGTYANFGDVTNIDWYQIGVAKYSDSWIIDVVSLTQLWAFVSSGTIKNINLLGGNVSTIYTLQTAIDELVLRGQKYWSGAMFICYRIDATKWEIAQFNYPIPSESLIANISNWRVIINSDTIQNINVQMKKGRILNVNNLVGEPTRIFTLQQAIQQIPAAERSSQMFITFRYSDNGFYLAQYGRWNVTDEYFYDVANWFYGDIGKLNIIGASTVFNVNKYLNQTATFTFQQAVQQVPASARFIGMLICFRETATRTRIFQYNIVSTTDEYFYDIANWNEIKKGSLLGTFLYTDTDLQVYESYNFSNFYRVKSGLRITVFRGQSVPGITFYDRNFDVISSVTDQTIFPILVEKTVVLGVDVQIPDGAFYFRYPGLQDSEPFIGLESVDANAIVAWKKQEIQPFTHLILASCMFPLSSAQIGDVISLTPTRNPQSNCICIKCKTGDIFYIKGRGGNEPRLWAFLDSDRKLHSVAENAATYDGNLIAPIDGYFLFQNDWSYQPDFRVYRQNISIPRIADVQQADWIALGDSISQGYYSDDVEPYYHLDPSKGWTNWVRRITGKTLDNQSIGGTGYACKGPQGTSPSGRELVDTLIAAGRFDNKKLVTLAYGVNDWKYNYTLGSMDDPVSSAATNIIPSMRYVIERILQANPNIKIVVIMPINCKFGNETNNWGIGYPFSNNGTLEQIFESFKTVCEYYGIEYIDMLHSSVVNRKNIAQMLLDSVHPSIPAHELMGRELAMKINCY